jgi:4-alpha-glucanotransferase
MPPNDSDPEGQNSGVLAWNPPALGEAAFRPFVEALRANMRDAGALRINQVRLLDNMALIFFHFVGCRDARSPAQTGRAVAN